MTSRIVMISTLSGAAVSHTPPTVPAQPQTWPQRVAMVGSPVWWYEAPDASGAVATVTAGTNGAIVNPQDYAQGTLIENPTAGGSSLALSGLYPNPTYIAFPSLVQSQQTLVLVLQLDRIQTGVPGGVFLYLASGGLGVAGGHEFSLLDDSHGGYKFRLAIADGTPSAVVKEGNTAAQLSAGVPHQVALVREAADMKVYVDGLVQSLALVSGAPTTWPAPAAGTSYLGAYVAGSASSNGLDGLISQAVLFNGVLTPSQIAFLAEHPLIQVVAAQATWTGPSILETAAQTPYSLQDRVHPAVGLSVTVTSQPAVGSATANPGAILATPAAVASVASDTGVSVGYQISRDGLSDNGVLNYTILNQQSAVLPEDLPLPTPTATTPGNTGNFDSLLGSSGSALPGHRITLAAGSYGNKTIARSGTQANPLQIVASPQFGPVFTGLTINGEWVIVSGVDVNGGAADTGSKLVISGSNTRFTRSRVRNGGYMVLIGANATDVLIDHCDIHRSNDRMFYLSEPRNQRRITVARCWTHELLNGGAVPDNSLMFAWNDNNVYREIDHVIIVRLNYIGPGLAAGATFTDWIHDKCTGSCYAFNRFDQNANNEGRFGLRRRLCRQLWAMARALIFGTIWVGTTATSSPTSARRLGGHIIMMIIRT